MGVVRLTVAKFTPSRVSFLCRASLCFLLHRVQEASEFYQDVEDADGD